MPPPPLFHLFATYRLWRHPSVVQEDEVGEKSHNVGFIAFVGAHRIAGHVQALEHRQLSQVHDGRLNMTVDAEDIKSQEKKKRVFGLEKTRAALI